MYTPRKKAGAFFKRNARPSGDAASSDGYEADSRAAMAGRSDAGGTRRT